MNRPALEVADVFRVHKENFIDQYGTSLSKQQHWHFDLRESSRLPEETRHRLRVEITWLPNDPLLLGCNLTRARDFVQLVECLDSQLYRDDCRTASALVAAI